MLSQPHPICGGRAVTSVGTSSLCVSAQQEVLVRARGGGGLLKERKALAALLPTFKLRLQHVD